MATKLKIKKGDQVIVLRGKDKGKKGEVLRVIPKETRAVVQGVNVIRRHTRADPDAARRDCRAGSVDSPFEPGVRRPPRRATRRGSGTSSSMTVARSASRSGPARS